MIRSRIWYYLVFFSCVFLLTLNNLGYCNIFFDLGFDGQYGVLWNYTLSQGLSPYKDIFYPYGILSYYSQYNFLTNTIPYILYLGIICSFLYLLNRIFSSRYVALFAGLGYVYFLEEYTGAYLVNRYGITLVFALFCVNLILFGKNSKKTFLFFGAINGLIFGFLGDPGIYSGILFTFVFLLSYIREIKTNFLVIIPRVIINLTLYIVGFLVGVTPFLIYLFSTKSFAHYIIFLKDISNLLEAWKTPLTPFLNSADNLFTLIIFCVSAFFVSIKFIQKKKFAVTDYYQMVILVFILLLVQKSIVKSIDRQITFIAFFLSIILLKEVIVELKKIAILKPFQNIYLFLFIFFVVAIYPFAQRPFLNNQDYKFYNNDVSTISECVESNNNAIAMSKGMYSNEKLTSFIHSQKSFYLFPGEPVWYVLAGVNPPKYVDTYTASYRDVEEYRLEYLKNEKPEYLLYNFARFAFLDGVPDYMRVPNELKFLLTHYVPIHREHETLIMERTDPPVDFFQSEIIKNDPVIPKHLLNISLGNVPRSEGNHKLESDSIFHFTNIQKNNNRNQFNSKGKILLVKHKDSDEEFSTISLNTNDGLETKIEYMNCEKETCVINLDRVPLFYVPREIISISFDIKNHEGYAVIENNPVFEFW